MRIRAQQSILQTGREVGNNVGHNGTAGAWYVATEPVGKRPSGVCTSPVQTQRGAARTRITTPASDGERLLMGVDSRRAYRTRREDQIGICAHQRPLMRICSDKDAQIHAGLIMG